MYCEIRMPSHRKECNPSECYEIESRVTSCTKTTFHELLLQTNSFYAHQNNVTGAYSLGVMVLNFFDSRLSMA